ncbi:MAG: hypothetical protein AB1333_02450 [Patescibacteria group bacterium]
MGHPYDHDNCSKTAKENGWINPLVEKVVKTGGHENFNISDKDYIEAINHLLKFLDFETGLNAESIGYDSETREDKILNLYSNLKKVSEFKEKKT